MNLLESAWFFKMVEQHGKTPAQRLIAVFTVTESWLGAPGMRDNLLSSPSSGYFLYNSRPFKEFLTEMAVAARARQPVSLVNQLIILLQGAIAEDMRNPQAGAIGEAGKAAHALIAEACPRQRAAWHFASIGMAAALLMALILHPGMQTPSASPTASPLLSAGLTDRTKAYNPDSIDAVLALQERIIQGVCPAPQLLALPPGQVTAYMNAINFRTPDDPIADRENLRAFLTWFERTRSSECYQPPANGHTTVAWVAS